MRTERRAVLVAGFASAILAVGILAGGILVSAPAWAEGDDHGGHAEVNLSELAPQQRKAALEAWNHVVCACPKENWSRTLANCPDGCATAQKQEVLKRVIAGWSLDAIVEEQVKLYGDKAAADPGSMVNGTFLVLAGLVIGGAAAGLVLSHWKKASDDRRTVAADARRQQPVASSESDAIERELREIE